MEYQEEKKDGKNSLLISVLALLILLVAIFGISFATITFTDKGSESNTLHTGELRMSYTESTNGITIEDAMPMSDDVGMKLNRENEYFDFTVGTKISGHATIAYEISAEKDVNSTLNEKDVKLYLEKKVGTNYETAMSPTEFTPLKKATQWGTPKGDMLFTTGVTSKTNEDSYRLRMWVRQDATISEEKKTFIVRVNVKGGVVS